MSQEEPANDARPLENETSMENQSPGQPHELTERNASQEQMSSVPQRASLSHVADESLRARATNRDAWDKMARDGNQFARPAKDRDLASPLDTVDARGWLGGDIRGKQVLCLAAGGGKQSVIYAAAGAIVTVVDISPEMLRLDREVAQERGINVETVATSMDDLSMFESGRFEIVIQPVSTCYLPNIGDVFGGVARVTRGGGIYVSQHKQPTNLQSALKPNAQGCYEIRESYYRTEKLPPSDRSALRETGTWEYVHRWEALIGLMCRSGFVIEDLTEPMHSRSEDEPGEFGHRCTYIAPYVRIKARRKTVDRQSETGSTIWLPS